MNVFSLEKLYECLFKAAVDLFGKPINNWIYDGIEFNDRPPSLNYYSESGHITISLSYKAKNDFLQQVFQLSHEMCHALYPSIEYPSLYRNTTLVINEGISTYFSILMMEKLCGLKETALKSVRLGNQSYYKALLLINIIFNYNNYAIKRLRMLQPRVDKLNLIDFEKADINIPYKHQIKLLMPFRI